MNQTLFVKLLAIFRWNVILKCTLILYFRAFHELNKANNVKSSIGKEYTCQADFR